MASEYGWTKDYIYYHTYPEEIPVLLGLIDKRRVEDYKMRINITHTAKPSKLIDALDRAVRTPQAETFDETSFELLKMRLSKNPKFEVK